MIGINRYRTLAAKLPSAPWLRFDGALTWDADNAANAISKVYAHERSIGYDARFLRADEIAAVTPGVNRHAIPPQGAIFNPGEGWVDLPSLIDLLLREFSALGGTLVSEAGRASIDIVNGRVIGVKAANGTYIEADAALLAVGPSVPQVVAEVGHHIPDSSPIGLLVRTKPIDSALRAVLNTPRVAVRPTPMGTLVLDSGWSLREVVRRTDGTFEVKDSTVQGLLAEASAVL
jgi:glycine/D-amino acid oxidase-like deaminating enzyme